jgi:hypothetical protein
MRIITWLSWLWPKLPHEVRIVGLIAVLAAGVSAGMVIGLLAWDSGFVRERLGIATERTAPQPPEQPPPPDIMQVVHHALSEYDANLRAYLAQERSAAIDTLLTPMLAALRELDKRQRIMLAATTANTERINDLPKAYDDRLERIMDRQPTNINALLQDIVERLDAQDRSLRELANKVNQTPSRKQTF